MCWRAKERKKVERKERRFITASYGMWQFDYAYYRRKNAG